MTANHIISDIRNIATSGSNPIEFKIEDSQILFWINEVRAMLISQALQRGQDISDVWVQKIACLELEQVDASDCCEDTTGCYVYQTVLELPATIETFGDNMIIRVTTSSGSIISKSNIFSEIYSDYNKYVNNKRIWWLNGRKVKVWSSMPLSKINVYLIAEDPSELSSYTSCDNSSCWTYDSNYPCSLKMASMITDIVVKTKVYPFLQFPSDNRNDADNASDGPVPKKI